VTDQGACLTSLSRYSGGMGVASTSASSWAHTGAMSYRDLEQMGQLYLRQAAKDSRVSNSAGNDARAKAGRATLRATVWASANIIATRAPVNT
jgi:hypothetical protein